MQKIVPCLWFDGQAEDAAKFYASIFPNSKLLSVSHYGESGPGPKGTVMTVAFEINGQEYLALNGGPEYTFSEAISLMVDCDTQAEIDRFWEQLTAGGGAPGPCGWLKDKFGLSWQVVPTNLVKLLTDPHPAKANAVMQAMLRMGKLDIGTLKQAYDSAK